MRQSSRLQVLNVTNFNVNQFGEIKLINLDLRMNENFEIIFKQVILPETIDLNDERLRSDCHPDSGASQTSCQLRGCTWQPATLIGVAIPWCFIAKTRSSYSLQGSPTLSTALERSTRVYKAAKSHASTFYGEDFNTLRVTVELKGAKQARIKIEDDTTLRYCLDCAESTLQNSN